MTAELPYAKDRDIPLGIPGFRYADLYRPERLADLLAAFDQALAAADGELAKAYLAHRAHPEALPKAQASDLLIKVGPHVARFVARLFGAPANSPERAAEIEALSLLKKKVLQAADKRFKDTDPATMDAEALIGSRALLERKISAGEEPARRSWPSSSWSGTTPPTRHPGRLGSPSGRFHEVSRRLGPFRRPKTMDLRGLVELTIPGRPAPLVEGPEHHRRRRDGFGLTDPRMTSPAPPPRWTTILCHPRAGIPAPPAWRRRCGEEEPSGIPCGCP